MHVTLPSEATRAAPDMLLLDLTHTSHTPARTGIQRVARALYQDLGDSSLAITRDPFLDRWRALEPWERANLLRTQGGQKRRANWPQSAKWRGRLRRLFGQTARHALSGNYRGLIVPEVFGPRMAEAYEELFAHVEGPRVAVFHDAIPLRFPEISPASTVARYPRYLHELLLFDGIAANSEDSRDSLLSYWRWLKAPNPPPVVAITLGVTPSPPTSVRPTAPQTRPVVLSIGTLEGRKNHLSLFEACELLWAHGISFELRVIGHVNSETGTAALARLRSLQAAGRPLRFEGTASDEALAQAYAECTFTVYPSIAEGFGLPVIESLARGKPCICSARGALGEISRHGGCLPLESLTPAALAGAIEHLLRSPADVDRLSAAARARRFKSWTDYTRELLSWMQTVPRR